MQYYFSVNLDSVYDGPFAPVYQLARVEMEKRNAFQLLVELSFHNGVEEETEQFYSKPFMMRSKPRRKKQQSGGCELRTHHNFWAFQWGVKTSTFRQNANDWCRILFHLLTLLSCVLGQRGILLVPEGIPI